MSLVVIDVIFLLLIALLAIRCFLKGIISEIFSMAGFVLGIFASLYFYKNGAAFLREQFWPEIKIIPEILAFIALFLIVFLVVKLLSMLLKGVIDGVKLGGLDKILGLIFGLIEGIVVVSLVLFLFQLIKPVIDVSAILEGSIFAKYLLPLITEMELPNV